jgi:pyruvate/2-oxoglutarate dehydrogenase complex dihydrolipoamide dehydrogenase (E3) component
VSQDFDVVCLGGGVAGEAIAGGLRGSGLTLAIVERELVGGAGLPQTERGSLKVDPTTLEVQPGVFSAGDVTGLGGFTHLAYYHGQVIAIHPFPAFNRVLGASLEDLAAQVAR